MINQDETLAQKFVKKGFWLYFFTFLIGPLGYLIKIIISEDLSVGEVGMVYGVISFLSLLSAFNDLGCTESLNYFLPKYIIKKEYGRAKYLLRIALTMQLLSSIIIAGILFWIAPWIADVYFGAPVTQILRIAGIYFISINILHFSSVFFSVAQDTKLGKGVELFRLIMTAIGCGFLFLIGNGSPESYMWAWAIATILGCIYTSYLAYTRYFRPYFSGVTSVPSTSERSQFFRYALATLFTANIGILLSQVDMQLIIVMLGREATGYYSNYLSLLNIPFIFIVPIVAFLFPVISELYSRGETPKMRTIYARFALYFVIIGVWLGSFLFQNGELLAVTFFGEKFRESGVILAYSAFFLIFNLLVQINFQFLAGTGRVKERGRILLIVLPINIILNLVLILYLGVHGSALAVGLSWVPLWYLSYRAVGVTYTESIRWKELFKNIILALIAILIIWQIHTYITYPDGRIGYFVGLLVAMGVNLGIFTVGNLSLVREALTTIRHNR